MTIYLYLPVYKASYDLILELFKVIKEFNREYKYTLGESIKKEAIELVTDIYRANKLRKKILVRNLSACFWKYFCVLDNYDKLTAKF